MKPITILIADVHKLVREAWTLIFSKDQRFYVLAECGTATSAIEATQKLRPDIILLDTNLSGVGGIDGLSLLLQASPKSKVIAVSQQTSPSYAKKLIQQGASGFVTKKSTKKEFIDAIISVHAGEKYICSVVKEALLERFTDDSDQSSAQLSAREMAIVNLIKEGMSSKEIARHLSIAFKTVEAHRYNIMKKLKVKNSAELIDRINKGDS